MVSCGVGRLQPRLKDQVDCYYGEMNQFEKWKVKKMTLNLAENLEPIVV